MPILNDMQERFCELVVRGNVNHAEAYRQAGYKTKNPKCPAYSLMQKPHIRKRLNELRQERSEHSLKSDLDILEHLERQAFFDMRSVMDDEGKFLPIKEWPDAAIAALNGMDITIVRDRKGNIISTTYKPKVANKTTATDMLMKHRRLYPIAENRDKVPASKELMAHPRAARMIEASIKRMLLVEDATEEEIVAMEKAKKTLRIKNTQDADFEEIKNPESAP